MSVEAFVLRGTELPDSARILSFRGREALSTVYEFTIHLIVPLEAVTSSEGAVGTPATLEVNAADGSPRMTWHGLVTSFEFVHAMARHALFRLVLRPRLWQLSLNRHSRVWVAKRLPDVLEDVFKANGLTSDDYTLSLSNGYSPIDHVCQYHESDFDFVSRWMEREGIYYFFQHTGDKEILVLTDAPGVHEKSPAAPVRFFGAADDDVSAPEAVNWIRRRKTIVAHGVETADYNYLKPALAIEAKSPIDTEGSVGVVSVFGTHLPAPADAKHIAGVRAEEHKSRHVRFDGGGRVYELRAGYKFELDEHPLASMNGEYLATDVRHYGSQFSLAPEFRRWLGEDGNGPDSRVYAAEFGAIRSAVTFRPPLRTAWPRIWGLESARIDGATTSDYAQLDEHGRYLVKILFDESDLKDGKASTRIRMTQPHGGAPEGFHFPLRKDTEVMLAFVGGDPDRPVIVGVAPHAATPSPVTKSNHTQNVIMTGGENRIEIDDKAGEQYIGTHSPPENSRLHLGAHKGPYHDGHNFTLTTDGNGLMHTGGARNITVGGEQTEDVTGDLTEEYHSSQTTHVSGAFKETIDGGATQTIASGETRTVTGGLTETISGGETRTVNGGQKETVSGSVTRTVSASLTEKVGASVTRSVAAAQTETITGALSQTVAGGLTVTTPGAMTVTAAGGVTFTAPGGFTVVAPGGIHNVDGLWDKTGGKTGEFFGYKLSFLGGKSDISGLYVGAAKIKLEYYGLKLEKTAMIASHKGTDLREKATTVTNAGANVNVNGSTTAT